MSTRQSLSPVSCAAFAVYAAMAVGLCGLVNPSAHATPTGTFLDRLETRDIRVAAYNLGGFIDNDSGFTTTGPGFINATVFTAPNARVVRAIDADVWAFQEIDNLSANQVADALNRAAPLMDGRSWSTHRNAGQVIASKFPIVSTVTNVPGDPREPAIATIDLPEALTHQDLHVVNLHLKARSGSSNEARRLASVDHLLDYFVDTRNHASTRALPADTPIVVLGDYNTASGTAPIRNLANGRYTDPQRPTNASPDWDGTAMAVIDARHNVTGLPTYTFRTGSSQSRLDWHAYTDSVISLAQAFVLNTVAMSSDDLAAGGLERLDIVFDPAANRWDHLPVVADYRFITAVIPEPGTSAIVGTAMFLVWVGRGRSTRPEQTAR